jgi:hypothetical protein
MQTNQANTIGAFAFNLAASTLTLPTTYTVGIYTITQPSATGTLALYSQIPAVGTWGALNYPTWVSGSEFVKMTAAGTFALDANTYLTSNGISGMTSGQLGLAGSASTFTGSIAYATANIASTIVERDASNNINATTFTGALSGNLTAAATGGAAPGSTFTGAAAVTFDYHSFGAQVALTNPVTGPGSGATVGHLATMNAITGDVIADGGVVPTSFPGFGTTSGTAAQGGVIAAAGPTGGVSTVPVITYNAAGQLTAVTTASIIPAAAINLAAGGAGGVTGILPAANMAVVPTIVGSGTISTLAAPAGVVFCTATCAVTIPQAAAGNEFCVRNAPGVSTVITLNALAASNYYELINHSGWGTAAHSVVSGGAVTDMICLHGYDATHYSVASFYGTWAD